MRQPHALLLLVLAAAACGGDSTCDGTHTPTPIDPATTGAIAGSVRVTGTVPRSTPVQMSGECSALHRGAPDGGDVLVHDGRVENAFVWVKSGLGDRVFAVPATPIVIDQKGCMFQPRVAGAQVCQPIEFRNSDALLHNVHGTPGQSDAWNFGLGVQGSHRTVRLAKPEVMVVTRCDVHPWMRAYLGVVDHPFFAVTGADGAFELRGVPAGDYVVGAWHEVLGTREARVTVKPGTSETVDFAYGG
jgi:plastocyanin